METKLDKQFWKQMQDEQPDAMAHFNKWLYSLYKRNEYGKLPKFYDLPNELKIGILLTYFEMYDFEVEELKHAFQDRQTINEPRQTTKK